MKVLFLICCSLCCLFVPPVLAQQSGPAADPPAAPMPVLSLNALQNTHKLTGLIYYLEDSSRRMNFQQVSAYQQAGRFVRSASSEINFGYSSSVYWLRFQVKNLHPDASDKWFMEIGYPLLDQIEFYYKSKGGYWQHKKMGDLQPFYEREIPYRHFIVPLHLADTSVYTFYMRVSTKGLVQVPLEIISTEEFYNHNIKAELGYGIFYGIMLVMILYNLLLFLSLRDINYLYYVMAILGSSLLIASLSGHAYQHLLPGRPWWAASLITWSMAIWLATIPVTPTN